MNNIVPSIHRLAKDVWLVETPVHEGLRTVSLHMRKGDKHVWLWVKLAAGNMPVTAFPQFQIPLPALEDLEVHRQAFLAESATLDDAENHPVAIGTETFLVSGDRVMAYGFEETDHTLTVDLNARMPTFRWE